jgi:hypothetical protein
MNKITRTTSRPTLSPSYGKTVQRPANPTPAAAVPSHELQRIVAAMLG